MGGLSEKLLTLDEVARRLSLPADDVKVLIQEGRLAAFRLGGRLLRIRLADLEIFRKSEAGGWKPGTGKDLTRRNPASSLQPLASGFPASTPQTVADSIPLPASDLWDRVVDFLYFNDFYLVGILIFLTLLAVIFVL